MNEKKATALLGVASMLTLATVGFLGYRLYGQSRMPTQDELAQQARASRQVSSETAQTNIEALLKVTLADLTGKPQPFAQWDGKVRVFNYWATWCPPCIEEMPVFSRLQERHAAKGVQFIGIGMDEVEKMQTFANKTPVSYPLLVGVTGPSENPGLTVRGMPYTVVLDREGKVAFSLYGAVKEADLEPLLKRLAGE